MDEQKGTWEKRYRYANLWCFRCNLCRMTCPHSQSEEPQYRFCPHCGKPMEIKNEVTDEQV